ncbi:colicin E3-like toxin immunity protein [Pectobacterium parmentieri]|uniref:colicin E3-like toxin immunity protein n=1 Tax=Pectobacterium parmentieri TaxID=1905730 RepID=UPI0018E0132E|nr:colicin E3-like toxin immunity protein [Pectobacterium parmentieri]MBI0552602.1 cloacin [Pectobacterium parmentieri]MBI0561625.1 cloacin [Pectobacterium parmentieri]MBI0565911.1 cloacin [Pectobacterium parmentieri]
MGLKLRVNWFDKTTDDFIGKEYSNDFGYDDKIIEAFGLPLDDTMNNGFFDVIPDWVPVLQLHLTHKIDLKKFNYQVAFDYRDEW